MQKLWWTQQQQQQQRTSSTRMAAVTAARASPQPASAAAPALQAAARSAVGMRQRHSDRLVTMHGLSGDQVQVQAPNGEAHNPPSPAFTSLVGGLQSRGVVPSPCMDRNHVSEGVSSPPKALIWSAEFLHAELAASWIEVTSAQLAPNRVQPAPWYPLAGDGRPTGVTCLLQRPGRCFAPCCVR